MGALSKRAGFSNTMIQPIRAQSRRTSTNESRPGFNSHLRYGSSRQSTMMRYHSRKFWTELPVKLLYGRSDFQIIPDFPSQLVASPNMYSRLTRISQSDQEDWRNRLGSFYRGERLGIITSKQSNPWLQLDLSFQLFIVLVDNFATSFTFQSNFFPHRLSLSQDRSKVKNKE